MLPVTVKLAPTDDEAFETNPPIKVERPETARVEEAEMATLLMKPPAEENLETKVPEVL